MSASLAGLIAAAPISAGAAAFDLPDQDAFVIGRGMAFAATADNPSAIYYNPAGISQLPGHNLRAGFYGIYLNPSYEPNVAGGGTYENDGREQGIPQLYYTFSPEKLPISFGLGLYAPFGLSMEWPDDTGFRTIATKGQLTCFSGNPVVSWKVLDNLSIAAGATITYTEVDLRQGLFWPVQDFDEFRFEGDGWDVGYNVGVLYKPHEKVSLGATFRSAMEPNLEGTTRYYNEQFLPFPGGGGIPPFPTQEVDANADFQLPFKVICGISYRPTPKWNLEFNADYTDWSSVQTLTLKQAQGFPPFLPQDLAINLGWDSSWYYEFGVTHYFCERWHLSVGYIFNENSVPDDYYSPLVADLDRHFGSVGLGYNGERYSFDIAYQFGYGPDHVVSGSAPSATGQTADGTYSFISHAVAVSVGIHF